MSRQRHDGLARNSRIDFPKRRLKRFLSELALGQPQSLDIFSIVSLVDTRRRFTSSSRTRTMALWIVSCCSSMNLRFASDLDTLRWRTTSVTVVFRVALPSMKASAFWTSLPACESGKVDSRWTIVLTPTRWGTGRGMGAGRHHSFEKFGGETAFLHEVGLDGRKLGIRVFAEKRIVVDTQNADFRRYLYPGFAADVDNLVGAVVAGGKDRTGLGERLQPFREMHTAFDLVLEMCDVIHARDESSLVERRPECAAAFTAPVVVGTVAGIAIALVDALRQKRVGGQASDLLGVALDHCDAATAFRERPAREIHQNDGRAGFRDFGERIRRLRKAYEKTIRASGYFHAYRFGCEFAWRTVD